MTVVWLYSTRLTYKLFIKGGDNIMANISKKEVDDMLEILSYFKSMGALDVRRGERISFKCSHCGGTAYAGRSPNNGHLHIWCEKCGTLLSV